MKKVLISFAVAFVTVMTILFCGALDTSAEIFSGNCGTADSSVTWTLDTVTGILSLKGNGSTKDYSKSAVSGTTAPPWRKYADSIKTVSVDGLSGIGKFAFAGCENLASVSFPEEITVIKEGVFYGCTSLRSFELTKNVTEIGESAFYDCRALTELSFPAGIH